MSGVIAVDLNGIIRILVRKGWFSIEEYNNRLKGFDFHSYEAADKPQLVPLKGKKLPGKAVSLWVHCRNFPLLIKPLVKDEDDDIVSFALLLVDITNRVTAAEIKTYEIEVLENKIVKYLDDRKTIFDSNPDLLGRPKPKHHYLTHYGQAIRLFGPPLAYWTARFESKHRVSKNIAESAKNFKNISLTVSVRQQMRMASVYYTGMFATKDFTVPEKAVTKNELPQTVSGLWDRVRDFMSNDDLLCSEIFVKQQKYEKGDLVVLEVKEGCEVMEVGLIEVIVVKKNRIFFVMRTYEALKQSLGYFLTHGLNVDISIQEVHVLADSKPLIKHGTTVQFQFVLHHHLSDNYK